MNDAATNTYMQVSVWTLLFSYSGRNTNVVIAGSHGKMRPQNYLPQG